MAAEYRITLPDEEMPGGQLDRTRQAMELRGRRALTPLSNGVKWRVESLARRCANIRAVAPPVEARRCGIDCTTRRPALDRRRVFLISEDVKGGNHDENRL